MEKKTPSPFKRDIDRAYKRLQLASMVLGNVSGAYDTGDLKEAYRNAFEFAYHPDRPPQGRRWSARSKRCCRFT